VAERIEAGARVYAEALYDAACDAGRVHEVDEELGGFVRGLVENRTLARALLNPQLPREAKCRVAASVLRDADPLVKNAVLVMIDHGRLALLPDVHVALSEMAAVRERIIDVDVTTAVPLTQEQLSAIEQRIGDATGLRARVNPEVDDAIIGGLVLRARGVLLAAWVQRRLAELRRLLENAPLTVGSEA
jgi:F-type H+-transporting ATPase subunit delta